MANVLDYVASDGTYREATLEKLDTIIVNTGGASGGVVNKFGTNADIDIAGGNEVVAAFGGTLAIMTTADTLDIVSSSTADDVGGTGATLLLLQGIDASYLAVEEYITMDGVTPVTSVNSYLGINRAVVVASGTGDANAGIITIDDTSNAVGVQASIPVGASVTQQCIYHTPISKTLNLEFLMVSAIRLAGGGAQPEINVKGWSYSRVTDTVYAVIDLQMDLAIENNLVINYTNPVVFTGREVIYFTCSTDTDNTKVSMRFSGAETDS